MNMASQSQQSVFQDWSNIPPEILGLICSYLGKHDLLKARMVSHAWNAESLKVLQKSKFTQVLREWNMKQYILYTTPFGPRKLIIPFHLNFKINIALDLQPLTSYVDSLCKIFGPSCVSTFTLTTDNVYDPKNILVIGLHEFLALFSAGLKTLDFTRFNFRINLLNDENHIISFPNLTKLICNTIHRKTGTSGPEVPYISIIENSPKIEDLTLTHPCDLDIWPLKLNQLKSLSLHTGTLLTPRNILDKILASSGPPVLRELSLVHDHEIAVYDILKFLSPTLKSLKFRVPIHLRNSGNPRTLSFPILPHLEHFGLEYNGGNRCWLNPEDRFSQEIFPSLKSIELPIGFIFTHSPHRSQEGDFGIKFPKLNQLILRVYMHMQSEDWNEELEHLQNIFPTPSKLSLVNVGGNESVKHLLDRILKSNWSKNIQEIGMIGFHQNYLGQFFDEMEFSPRVVLESCGGILGDAIRREFENTMRRMRMKCEEVIVAPGISILTRANESGSFKMTNLTTIKLEMMDGPISYNLNNSYLSSIIPNLTCLGEHFPQLRMIEISGLRFHQKDMETWRRHILEFKSKFPSVVLNVP